MALFLNSGLTNIFSTLTQVAGAEVLINPSLLEVDDQNAPLPAPVVPLKKDKKKKKNAHRPPQWKLADTVQLDP